MKTLKLALATIVFGCGGSPRHVVERQDPSAAQPSAPARTAMTSSLSALTVRGDLAARQGTAAWKPMIQGDSLAGVTELRVERRGAIVALGDAAAAPVLYLRAGSRVRLSQDGSGVHVEVIEGRARLRHGASVSAYIDTAGGEVIVTSDVIVDGGATSRADVIPTGARPAAADWSLGLQLADRGEGVGRIQARGAGNTMETLELRTVSVDVKLAGDLAVTEVTHVFHNASNDRREGTFRFPIPDGAMLTGLALEIDGKLVEGEMVEREKAREVYDKVVDSMLDPALLEWEDGNWFKLRVFPLEPNADKKVVIRYVSPLARGTSRWEYGYAVSAPDQGTIGELTVKVDGQLALAQRHVDKGVELIVPVAAAKVPAVMQERRQDGVYTAVRIAPKLPALPSGVHAGRRVAVVFDTSRSSLEGRAQALDLLQTTLGELEPEDRVFVLASDVDLRPLTDDFVPVTPDAIAEAVTAIKAIEPDGASDLGGALAAVTAKHPTDVIYVGDGIPTWGELRPDELGKQVDRLGAPIEAALIGKGASTALWGELAGRSGGRAMIVNSEVAEKRFALIAAHGGDLARLTDARVEVPSGAILLPTAATTVFAGDEEVVVMKTPAGQPVPASLKLTGKLGGKPFVQDVRLAVAASTERVAQRWARQELLALEAADAPKEDIIALSVEHDVMSSYTSLLVLENDEMYKQFQIDRKNQAAADKLALANAPQVTGGDLDSLGARQASLSPDEIQPGDPEIKIPAPADARTVVVSFPFGETKVAMWDADQAAWMVRFLIDQGTPDGVYQVRITITHADGRVEVTSLPYTVDTKPPAVKLTAVRDGAGWKLRAVQLREDGVRRNDADRVEIQLPDGTILRLTQVARGRFEGRWDVDPTTAPVGPATLRVVVRDHALNQQVQDLVIP